MLLFMRVTVLNILDILNSIYNFILILLFLQFIFPQLLWLRLRLLYHH